MSLFVASRCAFRAAAPVKRQFARRYATEQASKPTPQSSSNYGAWFAAAAVVCGVSAYFVVPAGTFGATEAKAKEAAASAVEAKKALTGGDQGFVSLKLEDVETINHNTKRFRFKLPEDDMVSGVTTTSAILTKFKPAEAEKPVIRPYTPTSDEDARGYMDLIVKKYPNGPMSTHMHDMVPGQSLEIKGPLPKYPWAANKHQHIGLIAGGTGITPMFQLCRAIFNNPADKTKVTLVVGNVSEEDILLKKELAHLENTYPQRFRAFYVLDNPPAEWAGGKGFITKELLKTVLPEPKSENIKLFVCGPPPMMNAISGNKKSPRDQGELVGVLKELGYTPEQVYKF
ncbi:putative cytochrome b5 protein [Cercophora scortea]|uniref:NADH-cytochrome b5 reductase n=1 Tax=Cercophora scortea TaxID=314031 RepID=A0AAE0J4Z7_9PEZI|nr:putative cytochrome b5 protein [Cercophora scortea]